MGERARRRAILVWLLAAMGVAAIPSCARAAAGDVALVAPGAVETAVSADGSAVAFVTRLDLVEADRNAADDVYVARRPRDGGAPEYRLISRAPSGAPANGASRAVELSADGGTVAFVSDASNLVDGDGNGRADTFAATVTDGVIRRVNLTAAGAQADGGVPEGSRPSLSADGSLIAFADTAALTVDAPFGAGPYVYERPLPGGPTAYVAAGQEPSLSGDGKLVAYQRDGQVYANDGDETLVSRTPAGEPGNAASRRPDVSGDGALVAFASEATDLMDGTDENRGSDVFLRDRPGGRTELVSRDDTSRPAVGEFTSPSLSADGLQVAFLADRDLNGCGPGFDTVEVRDRYREGTYSAVRALEGQLPDGPTESVPYGTPSMAAGGGDVAYPSRASNLVSGDANGGPDGFVTSLGGLEDPDVFTSTGPVRASESAGGVDFTFDVCHRAGRAITSELGYQTQDGSATGIADYEATTSAVSIGADERQAVVHVPIVSDDADEPWETFYVRGTSGGAFVPARVRGTIVDDDPAATPGRIFFERSGEILALDPGARDPVPIVSGREPAVSRDGTRLAFVRTVLGVDELVVSAADGSDPVVVTDANATGLGAPYGRPAWSPDGRRLAVGQGDAIRVVDAGNGATQTPASGLTGLGETVSFSPDGALLAFSVAGTITTLDLDTGTRRTVGPGLAPSYGPGGDLVFERSPGLRRLPDGAATPVTFAPGDADGDPNEYSDHRPAYAPDGSAIVFEREDGSHRWLESAPVAGGAPTVLTPRTGQDRHPAWARGTGAAPAPPTVSIADATASEGGQLSFGVDLSAPAAGDVTVTAATGEGSATSPADFTARSATVTIAAGQTHATFAVATAQDALDEADETLTVTLGGASGATIADGSAVGTITDDDAAPTVSVGNASATEGSGVALPVTLSAASGRTVTVRLSTADGTAVAPGDYAAQTDVLVTVPAGQTTTTATVPTVQDTLDEPDETFTATLAGPQNATVDAGGATGTILDDDAPPPPSVSISAPAPVDEGQVLRFTVALSHAAATDAKVVLSTKDGTATAGSDYGARTLVEVTIPAGQTQAFFDVQTTGDFANEPDETVVAEIKSATNVTLGSPSSATGTIRNLGPPAASVGTPATVDEGAPLRFPVTISRALNVESRVRLSTVAVTATPGIDYTERLLQEVVIPPGQTQAFFDVQTIDDILPEPDETVKVEIRGGTNISLGSPTSATGTIHSTDLPLPAASVGTPATVDEGAPLRFPVSISRSLNVESRVRLSTVAVTATAGADYTERLLQEVVIPPGQTQAFFDVQTIDDPLVESDETVKVEIRGGTNISLGSPTSAIGTIHSTDIPPPAASVGTPTPVEEGQALRFPVSLSRSLNVESRVRLSTLDGTAKQPDDYTARSLQEVVIPPGQTQGFFDVATKGDTLTEGDETVSVEIRGGTNISLGSPSKSTGTIKDPVAILQAVRGLKLVGRLVGGTVDARLPGTDRWVDVGALAVLPVGTELDATGGVLDLDAAAGPKAGGMRSAAAPRTQRLRVSKGRFVLRQDKRTGLVTLALSGKGKSCARRLQAEGKGAFRTRGRFAEVTGTGARWLTVDGCASTRVTVGRGRVTVRDLRRARGRTVRAPRSVTVRRR